MVLRPCRKPSLLSSGEISEVSDIGVKTLWVWSKVLIDSVSDVNPVSSSHLPLRISFQGFILAPIFYIIWKFSTFWYALALRRLRRRVFVEFHEWVKRDELALNGIWELSILSKPVLRNVYILSTEKKCIMKWLTKFRACLLGSISVNIVPKKNLPAWLPCATYLMCCII